MLQTMYKNFQNVETNKTEIFDFYICKSKIRSFFVDFISIPVLHSLSQQSDGVF